MTPDPENVSRPRGILSPKDREFLLGEADFDVKSDAGRMARKRIRERITHTIVDFALLYNHLEPRDIEAVFNQDGLGEGLAHTHAFYAVGLDDIEKYSALVDGGLTEATGRGVEQLADVDIDDDNKVELTPEQRARLVYHAVAVGDEELAVKLVGGGEADE